MIEINGFSAYVPPSLRVRARPIYYIIGVVNQALGQNLILIITSKLAIFSKIGIFPRNTIGFLMVFTDTPYSPGENGDKKQNTLPYTLQFKVVEVRLIGADNPSALFSLSKSIILYFERNNNAPYRNTTRRGAFLFIRNAKPFNRAHPS